MYELTAPGSRLRKFAIHQFRWDYGTEDLCGQGESFFYLGAVMREVKDDYWYAITHTPDGSEKDPANLKGRYLEDPKFRVRWDSIHSVSGLASIIQWENKEVLPWQLELSLVIKHAVVLKRNQKQEETGGSIYFIPQELLHRCEASSTRSR